MTAKTAEQNLKWNVIKTHTTKNLQKFNVKLSWELSKAELQTTFNFWAKPYPCPFPYLKIFICRIRIRSRIPKYCSEALLKSFRYS